MSTAYFYLAARFKSQRETKEALEALRALIRDLAPRLEGNDFVSKPPSAQQMREMGITDLGDVPDLPVYEPEEVVEMSRWGDSWLIYFSDEVDHIADWEPLCQFLRHHGAVDADWLSEEDTDSFSELLSYRIGATTESMALRRLITLHDMEPAMLTADDWDAARAALRR